MDDAWSPSELPPVAATPLTTTGCVGLNLYVRRADGQPASADLHAYLGMGAHAIIARVGGDGAEVEALPPRGILTLILNLTRTLTPTPTPTQPQP